MQINQHGSMENDDRLRREYIKCTIARQFNKDGDKLQAQDTPPSPLGRFAKGVVKAIDRSIERQRDIKSSDSK